MEYELIEHCAPTLASLKTASLFCLTMADEAGCRQQVTDWHERLRHKGLAVMALRQRGDRALIYVYRESHLRADLGKPGVANFLARYDYRRMDVQGTLERLRERMEEEGFPHEIGIFLGYPLADVIGFIQNRGKCCKCAGCWKVYGDEAAARRLFAQYRKCRETYRRLWQLGKTVWQLTVAA